MKTTDTPISFEQLRAGASKGPFTTCANGNGDSTLAIRAINHFEIVTDCVSRPNAEAITRILNAFVHGDGTRVLRDTGNVFAALATGQLAGIKKDSPILADIRNLLAQLDGKATK